MKINKTVCDICGHIITDKNKQKEEEFKIYRKYKSGNCRQIDFCKDCYTKFEIWYFVESRK